MKRLVTPLIMAIFASTLTLGAGGCFVRTGPAYRQGGGGGHPDSHRHDHCHDRGGKHHKRVCHSHPHGGGHH